MEAMPAADTAATAADSSMKRGRAEVPEAYERAYVHDVYDAIAPHFSSTRFKAWPRIRAFLEALPTFAFVADVGCGNGKYFASAQRRAVASSVALKTLSEVVDAGARREDGDEGGARETVPGRRFLVGMDINLPLLRLTQRSVADPNFDPSTAALTTEGMKTGKKERKKEKAATPQAEEERREEKMPYTDVLRCDARACPFRAGTFDAALSVAVIHHYATAERRGEAVCSLLSLVKPAGGKVLIYVWALEGNENKPKFQQALEKDSGDMLVRWEMNAKYDQEKKIFQRYYHLFQKGELEELCLSAAKTLDTRVVIRESYFDKENWCVLLERSSDETID